MKRFAFGFALLAAGLFFFVAPAPAHAQEIGVSIGGRHGGFSVYIGGGHRHHPGCGHQGYEGGYWHHRHHPGCGHHYQPPVYHAPRTVIVYETVYVRVWDDWNQCWVMRKRVVERVVTVYWYPEHRCYGYYDGYGTFHRVR